MPAFGPLPTRVFPARVFLPLAISVLFGALATLPALVLAAPAFAQQAALPAPSKALLAELEGIYKDIHANPELPMQERRTAGIAAEWLRKQGYEVTEGVGGTDPAAYAKAEQTGRLKEIPSNHSPHFAPVIHPTLEVGVEAMLAAAGSWLAAASPQP